MYDNKYCCVVPFSDSLYCVVISAAVVVPAAEDHRDGPQTLEQQRGHTVTQV